MRLHQINARIAKLEARLTPASNRKIDFTEIARSIIVYRQRLTEAGEPVDHLTTGDLIARTFEHLTSKQCQFNAIDAAKAIVAYRAMLAELQRRKADRSLN
jgi:hypothetical protein